MGTAQASDYLENKLVDHLFRAATFSKPGIWVALFTTTPTDVAGSGVEVSGGLYARVNLPASDTNWMSTQGTNTPTTPSAGSSGLTSNAVAITFAAPNANWGTVTAFGIFDAASGGNLLIWDALTLPKTINNGDAAPSFAPGALQITIQ